jgi:hypothetical protein
MSADQAENVTHEPQDKSKSVNELAEMFDLCLVTLIDCWYIFCIFKAVGLFPVSRFWDYFSVFEVFKNAIYC